jgi:hypothetical protein
MIENNACDSGSRIVTTVRCPARHCDATKDDWSDYWRHVEDHCGEDYGLPPLDAPRPWEDRSPDHLVPLDED